MSRRPFAALARLAILAAILVLPALLAGCDGRKQAPQAPPPPKVTVKKPESRPVTDYLEFTGNTQAIESVDLRARVVGYLRSVNFKDGTLVKKGTVLFEIEPQNYQAALQQAQAALVSQQTLLTQSETELGRARRLLEAKAGPQTDVTRWTQARDSAKAGIEMAKAQIEQAKLNLEYTKVTAPFDGRIGRHLVDPGNLVGAGESTVLATIVRMDPMYAYFTLNERDYLRLKRSTGRGFAQNKGVSAPKLEMGLSDEQGYPHPGSLDFQDLGIDPQTGTIQLRGVFPNRDGAIVPGLFVRVRAPLGTKDTLVVPETAVTTGQLGASVLVVNGQNAVEPRQVKIGVSVDGQRAVLEGLAPEDRVIVGGQMLARPGMTVTPDEAGAPPVAGPQGQPAQPGQPNQANQPNQQGQPAGANKQS